MHTIQRHRKPSRILPPLIAGMSVLLVLFVSIYLQMAQRNISPMRPEVMMILPKPMYDTQSTKRPYLSIPQDIGSLPPSVSQTLTQIPDEDLASFHCSKKIVHEDGTFFFRSPHTHEGSEFITDTKYLSLLKSAAQTVSDPFSLLTARFCESDTGIIVMEYTTGDVSFHHPDEASDTNTYLSLIEPGKLPMQTILIHHDLWAYPGCKGALAWTKQNSIYYQCPLVSDHEVSDTYHRIDLPEQTQQMISSCVYSYQTQPVQRICTP